MIRMVLLGVAVSLAAVPAAAHDRHGRHALVASPAGVTVHRGHGGTIADRDRRFAGNAFGGSALFADRAYQGSTLWGGDGFNDWWHDRPDRAFPRWVANNVGCAKPWYTGAVLRC